MKDEKIILEDYNKNKSLIQWYKKRGFNPLHLVKGYYEKGKDALKIGLK